MIGRLETLRRGFNRRRDDVPMVQAMEPKPPPNPKIALRNWRALLDKVFMVQSLVGLEESVQLWLPSGTDGDQQLSLTSSEQLAEFIQIAEGMPPLQTKTKPPMEPEVCDHPGVRLTKGGNQHGKWVICLDCNARWKIPMSPTAKLKPKSAAVKKVKEEQVKEEPPSGAASSAAERFNLQRMEEKIRRKWVWNIRLSMQTL
jgi:hypothetical protein